MQVTCVVDSETGETISRAWASCVGQAAVDVRARAWWHWDFNTYIHRMTLDNENIYQPTSIDENIVDLKLSKLAFEGNRGNMFHFNV